MDGQQGVWNKGHRISKQLAVLFVSITKVRQLLIATTLKSYQLRQGQLQVSSKQQQGGLYSTRVEDDLLKHSCSMRIIMH